MRETGKLNLYLQLLPVAGITAWALPPIRSVAALDPHRTVNPTVNCACKGSRLHAPYENHFKTILSLQPWEKLFSMKLVSDAKKLGDQFLLFFSHSFVSALMSDSLQPHGLQHVRPPCPSLSPRVYSNPCPLSRWCHPTISSSVTPFSSCPQSFPISESFPMSQLFASGGQSIGASASASVLPMNTQDWYPLGWTGWISLQSKGLSRVFSNTTVQKHQFFGAQLSL